MMIQAILHADKNWGIGKNNGLMFSLPKDMKFFRQTTQGGVVIMGDKTLFSLPGGKPLKNRINIVLSFDMEKREDCTVVRSLDELGQELKKYPDTPIWVIGGCIVSWLFAVVVACGWRNTSSKTWTRRTAPQRKEAVNNGKLTESGSRIIVPGRSALHQLLGTAAVQ